MAFVKTTWTDDADPAITAAQLNRIEQGVADAHPSAAPTTRAVSLGTAYRPNMARPTLVMTAVGASGNSQVDISLGPTAGSVTRVAICGSTSEWTPCIFICPAGYYYVLGTSSGAPNVLGNAVTEVTL